MDTNRVDILDICLKELRANFDRDSLRVRRLLAMRAEVKECTPLAHSHSLDFSKTFLTDDGRLRQSCRHPGLDLGRGRSKQSGTSYIKSGLYCIERQAYCFDT